MPQVLTCDRSTPPEHRALLLDDDRVLITHSEQGSFMTAYAAGLENAEKAREWLK